MPKKKENIDMAKLAINGGDPVVKGGLGKSWPIFDETEENALLETLRSGAWNRREKVDEARRKIRSLSGRKIRDSARQRHRSLTVRPKGCWYYRRR